MDFIKLKKHLNDKKTQDIKDIDKDNPKNKFSTIFELNDFKASHLSLEEINKQIALLEC